MGTQFKNSSFKKGIAAKTAARRAKLKHGVATASIVASSVGNDLLKQAPIVLRKISSLKPAPKRVRKDDPAQFERVMKSIQTFGFVGAIFIAGDRIVDGHLCARALEKFGHDEIPTIDVSYLSKSEIEGLAIALNRTAETGEWDEDGLREVVAGLQYEDFDLTTLGFDLAELDAILLDPLSQGTGELDEVPEIPPGEPVSRLGDVWQLDKHRVACGSALDGKTYSVLMNGDKATVIFTDHPYNVKIKGNVSGLGKVKHDEFVMASGEQSKDEFSDFLKTSTALAVGHLIDRGVMFACMDFRSFGLLHQAGEQAGLSLINTAVWFKGNGGMGALYRSAHELIAVFCKGDSPAVNNVKLGAKGRNRTNVWEYAGANQPGSSANKALHLHPTPKSVEMVVDALLDVSNKGDVVLDPFLGSGTTIIAAEECGRIGRGIDLDPRYVDCAIRRWESLTGGTAILIETNESFTEVTARRADEASD